MWWVLVGLASAQTPSTPESTPGSAPDASGPQYLVEKTASTRFLGEALPGPTFAAGEQVTVLARSEGKVRIFTGERYGWVTPAALTSTAPAPELPELNLLPGAGGANPLLGGLPPLLPGTPPPAPGSP